MSFSRRYVVVIVIAIAIAVARIFRFIGSSLIDTHLPPASPAKITETYITKINIIP